MWVTHDKSEPGPTREGVGGSSQSSLSFTRINHTHNKSEQGSLGTDHRIHPWLAFFFLHFLFLSIKRFFMHSCMFQFFFNKCA